MPDLYLMRHGETVWNAEGRLQGALHAPLTPRGWQQAGWQAALVAGVGGLRLSSPQPRAQQTAHRVFGAHPFRIEPLLSEIGIGDFAGQLLADLEREQPDLFTGPPLAWYDRCPGGEGLGALATRCGRFLDTLTGTTAPVLIVSHGITLRMLRAVALERAPDRCPPDHWATGEMRQGAVHVVSGGACRTLCHPRDCD
ncbi:histidine phosphatase family protein [Paracoccus gahaiensis]|uniref:histidine phosphatase family protein n=1 Tax=Paracoccus gahaiensis TaxID=1706839 RepID=UPI001FEBEC45|nr:histidine phosphatase family protein [Paracoccus gahaiensis]